MHSLCASSDHCAQFSHFPRSALSAPSTSSTLSPLHSRTPQTQQRSPPFAPSYVRSSPCLRLWNSGKSSSLPRLSALISDLLTHFVIKFLALSPLPFRRVAYIGINILLYYWYTYIPNIYMYHTYIYRSYMYWVFFRCYQNSSDTEICHRATQMFGQRFGGES